MQRGSAGAPFKAFSFVRPMSHSTWAENEMEKTFDWLGNTINEIIFDKFHLVVIGYALVDLSYPSRIAPARSLVQVASDPNVAQISYHHALIETHPERYTGSPGHNFPKLSKL